MPEIREECWNAVSFELVDDWDGFTDEELDRIIKEIGATAYEAIPQILCSLEDLATKQGFFGYKRLGDMAVNRKLFRREVKAAAEMRAAVNRIFKINEIDTNKSV